MIKASAIISNNKIYTGKRHGDCLKQINIFGKRPADEIQGFITDDGKFLTREDAMIHAIDCKQIDKGKWGDRLYSEDLY